LLSDIATISAICRREKASKAFKKIQRDANLILLKLIRPVSTRFNYYYYCLQRVLKLKDHVIEITKNFKEYCPSSKRVLPIFSNDDWLILEDFVQVLESFEFAIFLLSFESSLTVNAYNEVYFALQLKLEYFSRSLKTNETMNLASKLDQKLEKETKKLSLDIEITSIFDIKFKGLSFYSVNDKKYLEGKAFELVKKFKPTRIVSKKNSNVFKMNLFLNRSNSSTSNVLTIEEEFNKYLKEPQGKIDDCPLTWWNIHQSKYFCVAKAAKKCLYVQVSSASIERLFSSLSDILTKKRNRMSFEILFVIAFLKVNLNQWGTKSFNQLSQIFDTPYEIKTISPLSENSIIELFEKMLLKEDEMYFSNEDIDIIDEEEILEINFIRTIRTNVQSKFVCVRICSSVQILSLVLTEQRWFLPIKRLIFE
jgi:hypothetical protein